MRKNHDVPSARILDRLLRRHGINGVSSRYRHAPGVIRQWIRLAGLNERHYQTESPNGDPPFTSMARPGSLDADDVKLILSLKGEVSCADLARKFEVSRTTIYKVWRGEYPSAIRESGAQMAPNWRQGGNPEGNLLSPI